ADAAQAVEVRSLTERDRAAGVAAVLAAHTELQMLAVSHRAEVAPLAGRSEQRHAGIPQAERGELAQLLGELERQRQAARDDRVDRRDGRQLLLRKHRV